MRRSIRSSALLLAALMGIAAGARAQQSSVEGTVRGADGAGLRGVNVFLVETLEGALTDSTGAFRFETGHRGSAILVLLHADFAEERRSVELPLTGPLAIALTEIVTVDAIRVRAGGYTAGDEPGSTLTSLDVVTTPGAQASVPLAIKALPGVQNVDDGSGLFVRGGDSQETRFFLNEAGVLDAIRPEEPTGSSAPQIDPFLLDRIFFSSGAFGARYGNALSAVVDLETRGRPERFEPSVGAHMAGVEGSVEGPLGERAGGALTLSRLHVGPIYAVNGSTRDYGTAPQGWEASGSLVWDYRPTGQLKAFAIGETFETAFEVEEASFEGEFDIESEASAAIVTWRDRLGPAEPVVTLSRSGARSEETGGAFRLDDDRASTQLLRCRHRAARERARPGRWRGDRADGRRADGRDPERRLRPRRRRPDRLSRLRRKRRARRSLPGGGVGGDVPARRDGRHPNRPLEPFGRTHVGPAAIPRVESAARGVAPPRRRRLPPGRRSAPLRA